MDIPVWMAERFAGPAHVEPPDGAPRALGAARELSWTANGVTAVTDLATLTARFLADGVFEVHLAAPQDLVLPSFSRLEVPLLTPPTQCGSGESDEGWRLDAAGLELRLERESTRLTLATAEGEVLFTDDDRLGTTLTPRGWRANWRLSLGDRIYGLGAKTGGLDRRGRRTILWSRDALVGEKSDPLYAAIPFFLVAREGRWLGVLVDSPARTIFDLGHTATDRLSFGTRNGALVYVVFAGPTLQKVLEQYTALTGRAPLPPRWSLGHHQSRYSYNDEDEVREIAAEFRRRDIPTDAIHLDIQYMRGFRVFTFNARRFPAPRQLSDDLGRDGFRLITIVDPGVKKDRRYSVYSEALERHYLTQEGRKPFAMKVWPGDAVFPDFYRDEVRRWWGEQHRVYTDAGIAGIWNDMNEPAGWKRAWYVGDGVIPLGEHDPGAASHRLDDGRTVPHEAVRNAYAHLENRATYEGLASLRPNERPFVLTRSAFAGTQRWAAQWTGDLMSTWSALRQSLPMMLGLGLSGQGFTGSDIGGFMSDSTPELYARWIQIGALAPFCRSHTALYTHRQEPWSFGTQVEAIARAALKMRYQLLPYLYSCFRETERNGMPLWRPLFAEFPEEAEILNVEDQLMVGPALLAAPVLEAGAASRRVLLPRGTWFDWYSGSAIEGGRSIDVETPLERMPLYVRADRCIPTQPEVRFADDRPEQPLIWEVFLTRDAHGEVGHVYEDDGHSFDYRHGEYRITRVVADAETLRFEPVEGVYASPRQASLVRLHAAGAKAATLDGVPVDGDGLVQLPHDGASHVLGLRWA